MQEFYITSRNTGKEYSMQVLFARRLKTILKTEIKGEVHTHIVDDTIIVDIYGVNSIVFRYTRYNISSEIVQGLNSEMLANSIVKRYTKYIRNLFFL